MPSEQIGARIATVYELQSAWLEPKLKEIGVSWGTFQLLTTINSAGKRASQVEVARRLGVTAATMSETIFAHVQKGLLDQVPSNRDRRVKIIQLTDRSKALLRQIKKLIAESENLMAQGLNAREAEQLADLLDRVLSNLEAATITSE